MNKNIKFYVRPKVSFADTQLPIETVLHKFPLLKKDDNLKLESREWLRELVKDWKKENKNENWTKIELTSKLIKYLDGELKNELRTLLGE